MKSMVLTMSMVLVIGFILAAVAGCDWFPKTPTPTATPEAIIPAEVLTARDAALVYVRHAYPDKAPAEGIKWTGRNTTPPRMVGVSFYEFAGDDWLMSIGVPVVAPGNIIYEVELTRQEIGFRWTGKLNAGYTVLESNLNVAVEVLTVRDMVLSYVRDHYPDQAPPESLVWVGERTTPEGSVGHESCRFTAGDWTMTVDYDLARFDQVVYAIKLHNPGIPFVWRGQVDARGEILEHR